MVSTTVKTVLTVILTIVVIVVALVFFLSSVIPNFNIFQPAGHVSSSATVLSNIRPLGRLMTYEAQFAKANINVSTRWGIGGICGVGAKHAAHGAVSAGFDLMRISEDDIQFDQNAGLITLMLPMPSITNCAVNEIVQYDAGGSSPLCSQSYDELRQVAQFSAIVSFVRDAREGGLIERSQAQAEILLESFLQNLISHASNGSSIRVDVRFKENSPITYAPSCSPQPPPGWVYNAETNELIKN